MQRSQVVIFNNLIQWKKTRLLYVITIVISPHMGEPQYEANMVHFTSDYPCRPVGPVTLEMVIMREL